MPQIHDKGYKRLFANRTIFRQLLETFVREDWVKDIDFEHGETIDKTFIDKRYRSRESDLIYKLPLHHSEVYIYIILEFQSTAPRFMALRVLNYLTNFYMDYVRTNRKIRTLPPVFPLVIYNGDAPWTAPTTLAELIDRSELLGPYQVAFEYFKIAENELDRETLLTASNIVSTLFLAEAHYDLNLLKSALLDIFDNESDKQAVSLFLNWFTQWANHGRMPSEDYEEIEQLYTDREEVSTMIETAIERYIERLRVQLKPELRAELKPELRAELKPELRAELKPELRAELEPEVRQQVEESVRVESLKNVARTMLAKGIDVTLIAEVTGLTVAEIKVLNTE